MKSLCPPASLLSALIPTLRNRGQSRISHSGARRACLARRGGARQAGGEPGAGRRAAIPRARRARTHLAVEDGEVVLAPGHGGDGGDQARAAAGDGVLSVSGAAVSAGRVQGEMRRSRQRILPMLVAAYGYLT